MKQENIKAASDFYASLFSDNVDSQVREDAFIYGAEWADSHLNLTWKDIRKICLIAKSVHKYYGFWYQTIYEEILDRFCKPEIWT